MNRFNRPRQTGFTILELLVATSITAMMLFLINRLFFDTVKAVGEGAQLGQILAANRAISEQIRRDADAMVGPSEGGFLVIINRRIGDWDDEDGLAGDNNFDGFVNHDQGESPSPTSDPEGVAYLRSDGSIDRRLIRSDQLVYIRTAEDLEPLAPGTANSFSNTAKAAYARLWYGHVLRTDPDGTGPANVRLGGGPNEIGTNWILGRQVLLLAGLSPASIYVDGLNAISLFRANIIGIGSPQPPLFMGFTDVSNQTLADITGPGGTLNTGFSNNQYEQIAYRFAFPDSVQGAFPYEQRLRANPNPDGASFTSSQIAQMHPYWLENVSDFVVEFAMDTDGTDGPSDPDTHGATGNLVWYGMSNPLPAQMIHNSPTTGLPRYARTVQHFGVPFLPKGEKRFTFRHDYPDYWPHLIRIRYRLHDRLGRYEEHVGDSNSNRRDSGKWFEQIIPVNRK